MKMLYHTHKMQTTWEGIIINESFLYPILVCYVMCFIICLNIKQKIGHTWLLEPHTLGNWYFKLSI